MKSGTRSASSPPPSPARKHTTLSVSVPLTNSEIEQLQRNKRALSDYVRKALTSKNPGGRPTSPARGHFKIPHLTASR